MQQRKESTQKEIESLFGEVDPILRRLEALTADIIALRVGAGSAPFINRALNELPNELTEIVNGLLDAKGRFVMGADAWERLT